MCVGRESNEGEGSVCERGVDGRRESDGGLPIALPMVTRVSAGRSAIGGGISERTTVLCVVVVSRVGGVASLWATMVGGSCSGPDGFPWVLGLDVARAFRRGTRSSGARVGWAVGVGLGLGGPVARLWAVMVEGGERPYT